MKWCIRFGCLTQQLPSVSTDSLISGRPGSPAFNGWCWLLFATSLPRWKRGGPVQPLNRFSCCGGSGCLGKWLWLAMGHHDTMTCGRFETWILGLSTFTSCNLKKPWKMGPPWLHPNDPKARYVHHRRLIGKSINEACSFSMKYV